MKSFSEIETTSKRASKALGFSWGIAEEIGKGIRLLELFGLPGIQNVNQYFNQRKNEKFKNIDMIKDHNEYKDLLFCPLTFGINFMDQIRSLEKFNKVTVTGLAYPLLVIPFLSKSSEVIGKKILCKLDEKEFLLNLNVNIFTNNLKNNSAIKSKNVEITFLENKDNFSQEEWINLYRFAEDTFVEETDSLKEGAAGAGLTDND